MQCFESQPVCFLFLDLAAADMKQLSFEIDGW